MVSFNYKLILNQGRILIDQPLQELRHAILMQNSQKVAELLGAGAQMSNEGNWTDSRDNLKHSLHFAIEHKNSEIVRN